jgi:acetylornithine aminotransferase
VLHVESAGNLSPVMQAYGRFPMTVVRGKGCYLWDDQGIKYLDFTAGIAVCALGHVPDQVKEVLQKQLATLWHCSNLFHIAPQEALAKRLTDATCCDQVFFCNSGAEANEGAVKLARLYAHRVQHRPSGQIVTFTHSFHGRTIATLTATAQTQLQEGFGPLVPGFKYLPYNSEEAIDTLRKDDDCIAVMMEMVQGEGGVIPADPQWVTKLAEVCRVKDILLIVDEVQTGIGRTGSFFAYEQYGIEPDIVTMAKALGSGIPIGAFMAKKKVSMLMTAGSHGSTFGGNPFAMTAGLATLDVFAKNHIIDHCRSVATYLMKKLWALQASYPGLIKEVRGKGLMIGVETAFPALDAVNELRTKHHVLLLTAGKFVLRILPPLIVTSEQIDRFIAALDEVLSSH